MLSTEISKELKTKIEVNQNQLKDAIKDHQRLIAKLQKARIEENVTRALTKEIEEMQHRIIILGLEQKGLVEKLRREYKLFQESLKGNAIKNGVEERRQNLSQAINRARKQNIIARTNTMQSASPSEESEIFSTPSTPEPIGINPLNPQDIPQTDFLNYFGLATHEVFKEIQNKRAERKRRRTANPQFLYTRGWDISKRKRKNYLASNVSPPNTRQSSKRLRVPSPTLKPSRSNSPNELLAPKKISAPPSPTWPTSLSLLRINQLRAASDKKICIECSAPENLLVCELCTNGFHLSCHNRPLTHTPKHCPRCFKELVQSPGEIVAKFLGKLRERDALAEKNQSLNAEMKKLEEKCFSLRARIKNQDESKEGMVKDGVIVEDKIKGLISLINTLRDSKSPILDSELSKDTKGEDSDPDVQFIEHVDEIASNSS